MFSNIDLKSEEECSSVIVVNYTGVYNITSLIKKTIINCFIIRLPASEVAKSTIQEGPQYSIYQKRDQIWSLKLQNSFQYRKG